jgi:hypothetical protein
VGHGARGGHAVALVGHGAGRSGAAADEGRSGAGDGAVDALGAAGAEFQHGAARAARTMRLALVAIRLWWLMASST